MTFPRYRQLMGGWRKSPPVHVLLRILLASFGWQPAEDDTSAADPAAGEEQSYENLLRDFMAAGGVVR